MTHEVILGSEIKINVNIKPITGDINISASEYDFNCSFYTGGRTVELNKSELKQIDDNNFIATIDTLKIGLGELKLKLTAYIPDEDFDDNLRTEITRINTGIIIIK